MFGSFPTTNTFGQQLGAGMTNFGGMNSFSSMSGMNPFGGMGGFGSAQQAGMTSPWSGFGTQTGFGQTVAQQPAQASVAQQPAQAPVDQSSFSQQQAPAADLPSQPIATRNFQSDDTVNNGNGNGNGYGYAGSSYSKPSSYGSSSYGNSNSYGSSSYSKPSSYGGSSYGNGNGYGSSSYGNNNNYGSSYSEPSYGPPFGIQSTGEYTTYYPEKLDLSKCGPSKIDQNNMNACTNLFFFVSFQHQPKILAQLTVHNTIHYPAIQTATFNVHLNVCSLNHAQLTSFGTHV